MTTKDWRALLGLCFLSSPFVAVFVWQFGMKVATTVFLFVSGITAFTFFWLYLTCKIFGEDNL